MNLKSAIVDDFLKAVFILSPIGIGICDANGIWLKVNDKLCALSGRSASELVDHSLSDLLLLQNSADLFHFLKNAIHSELKEFSCDGGLALSTGKAINVKLNISVLKSVCGLPLKFVCYFSTQEQINSIMSAVVEEEVQLKRFVQQAPVAVAIFDNDMNYLMASKRWNEDYNLSGSNIIGSNYWKTTEKIRPDWDIIIGNCLNGKVCEQVEDVFIRSDDSICWVKWNMYPWYKSFESIGGILIYTEIITDRIEAEMKFHTMVGNFTSGIFIIKKGSFSFVNQAFADILGCTTQELIVLPGFNSVIYPEDVSIVEDYFQSRHAEDGRMEKCEVRAVHKNGNIIWIDLSCSRTIFQGQFAMIGTFIDVTARKNHEIEKINAVKLLNQRFNELALLYRVGQILNSEEKELSIILKKLADIIPEAFQFPDRAVCRIKHNDITVGSIEFNDNVFCATSVTGIIKDVNCSAIIEVAYFEQVPLTGTDYFLPEEIKLLEIVAEMLSSFLSRKLYLRQIISEKELSDSIINSVPAAIYILDSKGKFLRWNKEFEIRSGYTADEISNMSPFDFYSKEDGIFVANKIKEVFEKGSAKVEVMTIKKDNRRVPYYFYAQRIQYEGETALIGTGLDVSELKDTEKKLITSYEQIRNLAAHIERVQEEEKIKIAREIHDELGQRLVVLKMDFAILAKEKCSLTEDAQSRIDTIFNLLDDTSVMVRRIATELRPGMLDDLGLIPALKWQSVDFEKRTGIITEFVAVENDFKIPDAIATVFFRVFQESLTNVAKHSKATRVKGTFENKSNFYTLSVADNGGGFDLSIVNSKKTLGLIGMEERIVRVGGQLLVDSTPGQGTHLTIKIPH
jgi:PAS domain S-box-containing protein